MPFNVDGGWKNLNHFPTSINGACIKSLSLESHPSIYHLVRLTPLIVAISPSQPWPGSCTIWCIAKEMNYLRAFDPRNCINLLSFNGCYFAINQLSSLGPGPGKSQTNRVSIQIPQKYQSCYYNLHETSTLDFLEVEDQSKRRILSMVQVL